MKQGKRYDYLKKLSVGLPTWANQKPKTRWKSQPREFSLPPRVASVFLRISFLQPTRDLLHTLLLFVST